VKLFVYGTLRPRRGERSARVHGAARLRGRLWDLGAYPGAMLDSEAPGFVHGEVIDGGDDAELLARLDAYEGAEYRRDRVTLQTDDGRQYACWIWVLVTEPPDAPRIESGVWEPADD
jgi:gamma-glutamylcyclotransferase (GGCT)/AIG2-like uncharacterized protein YtfP